MKTIEWNNVQADTPPPLSLGDWVPKMFSSTSQPSHWGRITVYVWKFKVSTRFVCESVYQPIVAVHFELVLSQLVDFESNLQSVLDSSQQDNNSMGSHVFMLLFNIYQVIWLVLNYT